MDDIAAAQSLLVGAILVWAGWGKAFGGLSAARARRSALPRLVGEQRAGAAYRLTGGLELLIAAAVLMPPWWILDGVATSLLAAGFVGYLGYAKAVAPDSSCGCVGAAAVPVSWRSQARAGLLLAAGLSILRADGGWPAAIGDRPAVVGGVLLVELAAFVALSPELDRWWLRPLRQWRVRVSHPLAGGPTQTPLASTEQQLLRSPAYRAVAGALRSDIRDHWDEGEWRFVCYTASHGTTEALAVFAVPRDRYAPEAVRVAIVDESTGATLYRPEPAPT